MTTSPCINVHTIFPYLSKSIPRIKRTKHLTFDIMHSLTIVSRSTVYPDHKSDEYETLRLSVSDLPMLACHYIQKGVLLTSLPQNDETVDPYSDVVSHLKSALATTLTHFLPLAGRLTTHSPSGHMHITLNSAGVEFIHASAKQLTLSHLLSPPNSNDIPDAFKLFFTLDSTLSYSGHTKPLAAVQITELADGIFIGCTVNHSVVDGTSFWHFFNTFAHISKCSVSNFKPIQNIPDFSRNTPFDSPAALRIPPGGPMATFDDNEPVRERIFHFSKNAISDLKNRANRISANTQPKRNNIYEKQAAEDHVQILTISSFQSLCALLWRSVTRSRNFTPHKKTTFRMAVNCRKRLEPNLSAHYFGNAIQSIPTFATAGDLLSNDLNWAAEQLNKNVVAHNDAKIRLGVKDWESDPRLFPLGNFDGAMITMGSSPRFPMYDNDFGWGRPLAVRSGKANKFDGKISAFPGRDGQGSVDLEVCLAPETMAGLEMDSEFMEYVSDFDWLG